MRILLVLLNLLFILPAFSQNLDSERASLILQTLNQFPDEWVAPLQLSNIRIENGIGRVDVNEKSKFSYYIQVEQPSDPLSKITLIPMATSRYTPTYYQTDEWWDQNKEALETAKRNGTPAPRQDMNEVSQWLREMKLSTNPLVFEITPQKPVKTERLQTYLFKLFLQKFENNGKIILYRGGEKPTETAEWLEGRRPRGVRYWTPTANYAWRYARKNRDFLDLLIEGRAPLYVFEIPVEHFQNMVQRRWPRLTLGTELTKNAHQSFDRRGQFIDHLTSHDYMGVGEYGVEFELRSNSKGANDMLQYFKRPIFPEELALDRISLLRKTLDRLKRSRPFESQRLDEVYQARIIQTEIEGKILTALQRKMSVQAIQLLLNRLGQSSEIANIDGAHFESFVRSKIPTLKQSSENDVQIELNTLNNIFDLTRTNLCSMIL